MASLDKLMSANFWEAVVFAALGFVGPTLLANTVETGGRDFPDEVYGVAAIVVEQMVLSGSMKSNAQIGSGLYTLDKLAERFGFKQSVLGAV